MRGTGDARRHEPPPLNDEDYRALAAFRYALRSFLHFSEAAAESLGLTPQPEAGVTYAAKIDKGETRLDWTQPWQQVHNHIRGLSPFPGAWFEIGGTRIKALRSTKGEGRGAPGAVLDNKLTIACREGAIRLTQVQRSGKQPMSADEFLRGTPVKAGAAVA